MTRPEARAKKQRAINRNTIIFPAEENPRGAVVNTIIKRHKHILQHSTVLKKLFPMNSFIVANKSKKTLRAGCSCRSLQHKNGSFKSN